MIEELTVFDRKICLVENWDIKGLVSELADGHSQSIFFCNVHMLMLAQEDKALAKAMDKADWVFADGVPVAWLQRRLSGKDAKVVRGYEIMLAVCDRAARNGEKVGFMGSTPNVMKQLVSNLSERFEGLPVPYQYCPPFMQGELVSTQAELQALKDAGIKWLFVGLGCPKQEKWIAKYGNKLDCHILGVGAAFDWLSGVVSKPPEWIERFALAWLIRLLNTPSKLWRRYLIYNAKFIMSVFKLVLGRNNGDSAS